jgi:hypothetical protein
VMGVRPYFFLLWHNLSVHCRLRPPRPMLRSNPARSARSSFSITHFTLATCKITANSRRISILASAGKAYPRLCQTRRDGALSSRSWFWTENGGSARR